MSNYIGPLSITVPNIRFMDESNIDGTEKIVIACTPQQAKQLRGLCEKSIKSDFGPVRIIRGSESRWGILPVDVAENVDFNEGITHKGLYQLSNLTEEQVNYTLSRVTLDAELLSVNTNEVLTLIHSQGGEDGSSIEMHEDYSDLTKVTILNETFLTFDDSTVWHPKYIENMTSGTIVPTGGKLVLSGASDTNWTWGYNWTTLRETLPDQFTAEFTLEWNALPASGDADHHINLFIVDGRPANKTELEYKDVIRIMVRVTPTGATLEIGKRVRGVDSALISPISLGATEKTPAIKLVYSGGTGVSNLTVYMDQDYTSGNPSYGNPIFGPAPTRVNFDLGKYLVLSEENASTTSATVKCELVDIYDYVEAVKPNIVVAPPDAICDQLPDFLRDSEDGNIQCFQNPTSFPNYQITPSDFYNGSVKGMNQNYADNTARLVTGNDFDLDPTKFTLSNGLIKLVPGTQSVAFQYWDGDSYVTLNTFTLPNPIMLIRPFLVSKDRFILQIDKTLWEMKAGSYGLWIKHPHDDLGYSLKSNYFHDSITTSNPTPNSNIPMLSQFYCNLYDYLNLVDENVATCGDAKETIEGFTPVNGVEYTNLAPEGIALCNNAALFNKNTGSESISVFESFLYSERNLKSIVVSCPGTNDDEGTYITYSGLTIGKEYTVLVSAFTEGLELGIFVPGPDAYTSYTPDNTVSETRLKFTATATSHDVAISLTTKTNAYISVALNMIAEGDIGNAPFVLPGEIGNTVKIVLAEETENQMRVVYTGNNYAMPFDQDDVDELVAIGATDVINLGYGNILDDYENTQAHVAASSTLFKASGINFHPGFWPFKHEDTSEESPTDTTYISAMAEAFQNLLTDCPNIAGISFDDYIYPASLHNSSNEATEEVELTNFIVAMKNAIYAIDPTAKLSGALYPLPNDQGNDIESFTNEFDFSMLMCTYRFKNNVSSFIRDRLEPTLALTGDNIVIPTILNFYDDSVPDEFWPVEQLLLDIYNILELNPQGFGIFDWLRHPTGLYCPVETGISNKAIRLLIPGEVSGEGLSFESSWTTGIQNTIKGKYILPSGVSLQVSLGGVNKTITGTGEMETFLETITPTTDTISIHTTSATPVPLLLEDIKVAEGTSIPLVTGDKYRMTIVKKDPTTIKSDSIPASDLTGIIVYDSTIPFEDYNGYLSLAREWFNPTWQTLVLQGVI